MNVEVINSQVIQTAQDLIGKNLGREGIKLLKVMLGVATIVWLEKFS